MEKFSSSKIDSILNFINQIYFLIRWCIRAKTRGLSDNMSCLVGKTAIVTGGNSGIGYATATLLASRGCRVIIATNMNAEKDRESIINSTGNSNIIIEYLDLSKLNSIRSFAEHINREDKIDILINNAGISASSQNCTEDGLNTIMQVNYFGHFLLTHLLLDKLKASGSARVVFISSISTNSHKLKTENYLNYISTQVKDGKDAMKSYANSKLCCMLAAQEFGHRLRQFGIIVKSCDPGICETPIYDTFRELKLKNTGRIELTVKMVFYLFQTDTMRAAQSSFHVAASEKLEEGSNYFRCKPFIVNRVLEDEKFCQAIWNKSEELVKLKKSEKIY